MIVRRHPILSSLIVWIAWCVLGIPYATAAELCGDGDRNGAVTVTDGVAALRAAANLFSKCPTPLCDVDGSGTVSVSDGVNILRSAVELPSTQSCPEQDSAALDQVQTSGGTQARLEVGLAPVPSPGAPTTISSVTSGTQASKGRTNAFVVDYNVRGAAAAASVGGSSATSPPTLIVAARRTGEERRNAFSLPLSADAGEEKIAVSFPTNIDAPSISVDFATKSGAGEVSNYVTVTLTPTSEPICNDGVKDPNEDCDPPGKPCGTSGFCNTACQCTNDAFCGNGSREGTEQCDGPDNTQCGGTACGANCMCRPPICGDNKRQGAEQCDGLDASACGSLACLASCTCGTSSCGNNAREGDEECDGTDKVACGSRACQPDCLCALE